MRILVVEDEKDLNIIKTFGKESIIVWMPVETEKSARLYGDDIV